MKLLAVSLAASRRFGLKSSARILLLISNTKLISTILTEVSERSRIALGFAIAVIIKDKIIR